METSKPFLAQAILAQVLAQGGAFTPAFPPGRMVPARALPGAAEEEPAPL